jgi:hypothetical protein
MHESLPSWNWYCCEEKKELFSIPQSLEDGDRGQGHRTLGHAKTSSAWHCYMFFSHKAPVSILDQLLLANPCLWVLEGGLVTSLTQNTLDWALPACNRDSSL